MSSIIQVAKKQDDPEITNFFMLDREELLNFIKNDTDFPEALNFRFVIALPILESKTKSGLITMSTETMDYAYTGNNIGRIMAIGGTVGGANGNFEDCCKLKVGDYIQYNPHTGLPLNYNGSKFIVVSDEAIMTRLNNPMKHTDGIFNTFSIRGLNG